MIFNSISNIDSCYVEIPQLTLYSHIPTTIIALLLGFFVYFKVRNSSSIVGKVLLASSLFFSVWAGLDLYLWLGTDSRLIMFCWSVVNLLEVLSSSSALYFSYVFLEKNDPPFRYKVIFGSLILLFAFFLPTLFNLRGFDSVNCEARQGPLVYYFYFIEIFTFIWLSIYLIKKIITTRKFERKITALFSVGVVLFLASFSGANIVSSLTEHWEILQYGLFGMPVFMALLAYLIIRYRVFNIKLFAAHALVLAMVILIGSQFLFIKTRINQVLTAITLVLIMFFGIWLARSVKKEIEQRENLEKVTRELKMANLRLKELDQQKTEFLSIASHQLRTPLSIVKGYIELIKDGGYGKVTKATVEILDNMDESNQRLVNLVDDFLNITRIEQGRTKFDFTKNNINEMVESVVKELEPRAEQNNLKIIRKIPTVNFEVLCDQEKIRNVIFNFIDNAIKYTEKGQITAILEKHDNGVVVRVRDTGFGFGDDDQANFFQKFFRGENVRGTNVTGTGLGLYVCRKFIEAHGGEVWAKSPGLKKGSEFGFWIPFVPKPKV